jgi:hypothetical protein
MAGPYSYVWDDFTGGWAGDVDRSKATKGQWFGQDVLVYEDGLLGPRHPLRQVTLTAPPTVDNGRVDEAILFENVVWARPTSVAIFANDDFWFIDGFANFDSAVPIDVTKTAGLRGGVMGVTLDSPNGLIYVTQAGTAPKLERINATGVVTDTAGAGTPDGEVLIRWNERMILAQRDSIFWSDAASFTSWPGANTAKVGDGAPVVALIPTPLALYIAKTSGWWVITGVLGSTAIQRQVGVNEGVEPAQIVGGAGDDDEGRRPSRRGVAAGDAAPAPPGERLPLRPRRRRRPARVRCRAVRAAVLLGRPDRGPGRHPSVPPGPPREPRQQRRHR